MRAEGVSTRHKTHVGSLPAGVHVDGNRVLSIYLSNVGYELRVELESRVEDELRVNKLLSSLNSVWAESVSRMNGVSINECRG